MGFWIHLEGIDSGADRSRDKSVKISSVNHRQLSTNDTRGYSFSKLVINAGVETMEEIDVLIDLLRETKYCLQDNKKGK